MYFTDIAFTYTEIPDRLGRYRTSAPVVTELRIREWRLTTSGVLAPSVWDVESALLRAPSLPLVEPVSSGGLVDSRSSITRSMGILPFRQLMYRWQKLSHNSWTCRQTKHLTLLPHYCKSLKRSLSLRPSSPLLHPYTHEEQNSVKVPGEGIYICNRHWSKQNTDFQ